MSSEREAKLTASPQMRLPNLDGLVPDALAIALATRDLDAVYYDTAELDLVRSGITLRHRSGEGGPLWTLKLPEGRSGQVVTRRELNFEGPPADVPVAARDIVSAYVRSRLLVPIARLRTNRSPLEIRDASGARLAEIVDDCVTAHDGKVPPAQFREVEVEVFTEGKGANELLDTAVDRLVAAGCRAETPLPKLVRVLGSRAFAPPDLVAPSITRKASLHQLIRYAFAHSVLQMLQHDPGVRLGEDPEDVHQFRVAIRQLRSDLRTFMPLLEPGPTQVLRDELHWLGSAIGGARDKDVLAERLRGETEALPANDAAGMRLLRSLLASQADIARAAMLSALRNPRYLTLLDRLIVSANEPPIRGDQASRARQPASRHAARFVRRPWRRLSEAVSSLDDEPSDRALHNVRILAKRCRYATEAVAPVIERADRLAAALADVQTVLGEHHDTVIAEAWLREAANLAPEATLAAGELIFLQRSDRERLRSEWRATWNMASAKDLRSWI